MANPVSNLRSEKEKLEESLDKAKTFAHEFADKVQHKVEEIPELIKKHPYESIAVGFGAGLVAGFIAKKIFE